MRSLCRDCLSTDLFGKRCDTCGSPRTIKHPELFDLSIAHMDCDAFYASVEKRENRDLANKPVIIGGGRKGVVSTACYIARIRGVRSAMPMFKALTLCPDAVVLKPRMSLYTKISKEIRQMMDELTPAIEQVSLDEAFIDLTGTKKLHGVPPATMLAKLVKRIHKELSLTVSIGLSYNKFLAKIASDLDKPRGFFVVGEGDSKKFLKNKPVGVIWGVGKTMQRSLELSGIRTFNDLLRWEREDLNARFGKMGERLWFLARGKDYRNVQSRTPIKSVSNEITFLENIGEPELLYGHLWRICERVSSRMKAKMITGYVATLKLKTADHKIITKRTTLREPTQLADRLYAATKSLMEQIEIGQAYRLIGAGLSDIGPENQSYKSEDFLDTEALKRDKVERARDVIRKKFGQDAIIKGRSLRSK